MAVLFSPHFARGFAAHSRAQQANPTALQYVIVTGYFFKLKIHFIRQF